MMAFQPILTWYLVWSVILNNAGDGGDDDGDDDDDDDGQPECDWVDNGLEEKNRPQAFGARHHLLKACSHLSNNYNTKLAAPKYQSILLPPLPIKVLSGN